MKAKKINLVASGLVGVALLSVLFGTLGFHAKDSDNSWVTCAYEAVQLFTMNSGGVTGEVPWMLEVARWLAPLATLGAFFAAASVFIGRFRTTIRLFWISDHTIICGAGEKGSAITRDLLGSDESRRVVLVELCPEASNLKELAEAGVIVITGDARDADVLAEAKLDRAARLVSVAGKDEDNLAISLVAAKTVTSSRASAPLRIHAHLSDPSLCDVLQRNSVLDMQSEKQHQIRVFNFFRNRARLMLERTPLEVDNRGSLKAGPHLILPELDRQGEALVIQAALVGHYPEDGKVTVHLVSRDAAVQKSRFLRAYPNYEKSARLVIHELDSETELEKMVHILEGLETGEFATIYLGSRAEEEALTISLLLREHLRDCADRCRILIFEREGGVTHKILADKPNEKTDALNSWVKIIPRVVEACGRDSVFAESLDKTARTIHEVWYRGNAEAIENAAAKGEMAKVERLRSKETFKDWDDLTEEQKDVNRHAADHLEVKVRAMGMNPDDPRLRQKWDELSPDQVEMLSRVEHERWSAALWLAGWKHGNERNDTLRTHNSLTSYGHLDDGTKEYDRAQVKKVAEYLLVDGGEGLRPA